MEAFQQAGQSLADLEKLVGVPVQRSGMATLHHRWVNGPSSVFDPWSQQGSLLKAQAGLSHHGAGLQEQGSQAWEAFRVCLHLQGGYVLNTQQLHRRASRAALRVCLQPQCKLMQVEQLKDKPFHGMTVQRGLAMLRRGSGFA